MVPASSDMHPSSSGVLCASVDAWMRPEAVSPRVCDADSGACPDGEPTSTAAAKPRLQPASAAKGTASVQLNAALGASPADSETVRKTLSVFVTNAVSNLRQPGDAVPAAKVGQQASLVPAAATPAHAAGCKERDCTGESPDAADVAQVTPRQSHRRSTLSTPLESGSASSGSPAGGGDISGPGPSAAHSRTAEERRQRALARSSLKRRQPPCTASPAQETSGAKRHRRATRTLDMAAAIGGAPGGVPESVLNSSKRTGLQADQDAAVMPEFCNSDSPMIHGAAHPYSHLWSTEVTPQLLVPGDEIVTAAASDAAAGDCAAEPRLAVHHCTVAGQSSVAPAAEMQPAAGGMHGDVPDVEMQLDTDDTTTPRPNGVFLEAGHPQGPDACQPNTTELWGIGVDVRPPSGTPLTAASLPPIMGRVPHKGPETASEKGAERQAEAAPRREPPPPQALVAGSTAVHAGAPDAMEHAVATKPASLIGAAEPGPGLRHPDACEGAASHTAAVALEETARGQVEPAADVAMEEASPGQLEPAAPEPGLQSPQLAIPASAEALLAGQGCMMFRRFSITPVSELRKRRGRPPKGCGTPKAKPTQAAATPPSRVSPRLRSRQTSSGGPDGAGGEGSLSAAEATPTRPRRSSRASAPAATALFDTGDASPCSGQRPGCAAAISTPARISGAPSGTAPLEVHGSGDHTGGCPADESGSAHAEALLPDRAGGAPAEGRLPGYSRDGHAEDMLPDRSSDACADGMQSVRSGDAAERCVTKATIEADSDARPSTEIEAATKPNAQPAKDTAAPEPEQGCQGHSDAVQPPEPEAAAAADRQTAPAKVLLPTGPSLQECTPPAPAEESPLILTNPAHCGDGAPDETPPTYCGKVAEEPQAPEHDCADTLGDVTAVGQQLQQSPPVLPARAQLSADAGTFIADIDTVVDGGAVSTGAAPAAAVPEVHAVACTDSTPATCALPRVYEPHVECSMHDGGSLSGQEPTTSAVAGLMVEPAAQDSERLAAVGDERASPLGASPLRASPLGTALFDPDIESPRGSAAPGALTLQLLCMNEAPSAALSGELVEAAAPSAVMAPSAAAQQATIAPCDPRSRDTPVATGVPAAKRVMLPAPGGSDGSLRPKRVLCQSEPSARNRCMHGAGPAPPMHTSVRPAFCVASS